MPRRPDRPESCLLDASEDCCLDCPNAIPPCDGIENRDNCSGIIAQGVTQAAETAQTQKLAKPRGNLDDAIKAAQTYRESTQTTNPTPRV